MISAALYDQIRQYLGDGTIPGANLVAKILPGAYLAGADLAW
jgi:hypothetical protein